MKLEVHIGKKHAFFIITSMLLLATSVLVIAQVPNPGHDVAAISGAQVDVNENCPSGSSIRQINNDGSVVCEEHTQGFTQCRRVEADASGCSGGENGCQTSEVFCDNDEYRTGGGGACAGNAKWMQSSRPIGGGSDGLGGGWKIACHYEASTSTRAWIICCS